MKNVVKYPMTLLIRVLKTILQERTGNEVKRILIITIILNTIIYSCFTVVKIKRQYTACDHHLIFMDNTIHMEEGVA